MKGQTDEADGTKLQSWYNVCFVVSASTGKILHTSIALLISQQYCEPALVLEMFVRIIPLNP